MSLEAPNLDSRTFADLVKEARDRIPRFTPDWTNLNDADPGMTLVKLHAWLTETLLYEVNRLPELNYIKFLQLLNVKPEPAKAARAELHFTLKKLDRAEDPLKLFIPKNAQIEADDPDLTQPVIFETDRTLTALNARVAAIIVSDLDNDTRPLNLVTSFDAKKAVTSINHSFYPFGRQPEGGEVCLIGLLLRPHRKAGVDYSQDIFPSGELDLTVSAVEVFEKDDQGHVVTGPLGKEALLPHQMTEQQQWLTWQVYVGSNPAGEFANISANATGWETLTPSVDESAALSRSGHLRPSLPEDISQVSLHQLPRSFWIDMGLKKPPATREELIADLEDSELHYDMIRAKAIPWEVMVTESGITEVLGACESIEALVDAIETLTGPVNVSAVARQDWIDLDVGYSDPAVPEQAMAWLRVRLNDTAYTPVLLNGFFLNTVPATAAVTRVEEILGTSDGRPAQQFILAKTPVYFDPETSAPDLLLEVVEAGQSTPWQRVNDFFGATSHDEIFQLDEATGRITFGDGVYGRIPIAGATLIARRYRFGGGDQGNVGADTITKIKTSLRMVDSVTNPRAAVGGRAMESLENAKLRAPHELKTRDRAVTAEDFALLAKQTPGVPVHTAYALAQRALNSDQITLIPRDGAVTVVILPANTASETPQPSEAQLDAVCAYLNPRRLITTELYVTGPRYLPIDSLSLEVRARQSADLQTVSDGIYGQLLRYFHPLTGGEENKGWPFGEDIYLGNLYDLLLQVEGVRRVVRLQVRLQGVPDNECVDFLPVPEGHLLHLRRDRIQLQVVYDKH